jgi:hypothetical protein
LFTRIERWSNQADLTDVFWRSISKDNITTWYGKTEASRIFDPTDATHIFSWLISERYDDKGNVIVYAYEKENSAKVGQTLAHEDHRTDESRSANRHLKRIYYGNHQPYLPELLADKPWPMLPEKDQWFFEVVFDYGEHDLKKPLPEESNQTWPCRPDPFSSYKAGFEIRTYRLCQRVLMFHHFPREKEGQNCLVRSTDFTYSLEESPTLTSYPNFSFLLAVTQIGYQRGTGNDYRTKAWPPLEFEYILPKIDETVREVDRESVMNLPQGLDGQEYQWIDLDGEGLSGVLTEQAGGWFYKRNLSPITIRNEAKEPLTEVKLGPPELVGVKPSLANLDSGRQQLLDLAGDGRLDLVQFGGSVPGFYERTTEGGWESFTSFASLPVLDWNNPNLKFVDLTGDGHADILISEDQVFWGYPSRAEVGFGPPQKVHQAFDEEKGSKLIFADGTHSIFMADMSGDGLTDLVRIGNGEVAYWPNLGYGRFGTKITMDNSPYVDFPERFNPSQIRLADIDGSGAMDLIYLGVNGPSFYFNQSGNGWSEGKQLSRFPGVDNYVSIQVTDLLGNGTACLVWSSPWPEDALRPMRYVDLMGGRKPYLLTKMANNLGAETEIDYAPSTKFYLADQQAGKPWITKIPFPVHVVERVIIYDRISGNRFVTRYAYHHGYFDGDEREFRGFGRVDQWDTEEFAALNMDTRQVGTNVDKASHLLPVLTRTWFHTGVFRGRDHISNFFAGLGADNGRGEYYREPGWNDEDARRHLLDDTVLSAGLTREEEREACRALKGSMLRQEVYALDETAKAQHPYLVTEQNLQIRLLQPQAWNKHAVF